jgi:hypothetical protein
LPALPLPAALRSLYLLRSAFTWWLLSEQAWRRPA